MDWLSRFGAQYGACRQTYANEMWHFELVADATGACPLMAARLHVRVGGHYCRTARHTAGILRV